MKHFVHFRVTICSNLAKYVDHDRGISLAAKAGENSQSHRSQIESRRNLHDIGI